MTKLRVPPKSAIAPAPWERHEIAAVQALWRGEADAQQQRRAVEWILDAVCRVNDMEYRPGSFDETAFAAGRRYVGSQIILATKLNLAAFGEDRGELLSPQDDKP